MIQHNDHVITWALAHFDQALAILDRILHEPEDIIVTMDHYAPPQYRYVATEGDFDYGCKTGQGRTPLAAIVDLLDQLED